MSRLALLGLLGLSLLMPKASAAPADTGAASNASARWIERLPPVEPLPASEPSSPFELPFLLEPLPPATSMAMERKDGDKNRSDVKNAEKKDTEEKEEKAVEIPSDADATVTSETDFELDWLSPRVAKTLHQWCKPWSGSCELGVDGSAGNSDTFNIRLGLDAKRKTEEDAITFDLDYHKNTNDAVETANRLFFDWRYERPYVNTPWTWFVQGTTIYDEFQPWNVRVTASTGFGYHLIKTETTTLVSRYGGGFSHEIGGPDDSYVPELNLGLDAERQLTKRQKIKASVEYFPNVTEFDNFRLVSKADWEVLLDEEVNLSLKFSAADRYKRPNTGGKLNDVDYSMVLLWKF